jgi:purine nucleosidase
MAFPQLEETVRLQRLAPPTGRVSMVLDTDTANEIDDQFAVAYALLSPDRLDVEALYAAPFSNSRSTGPEDGMERSYDEILRLLDRMGRSPDGLVLKGARGYLPAADEPAPSPAAEDLVSRAIAPREGPLYVLAIGAITNVASALLLEPATIERIVVVWLGGQPHTWHTAIEFNLRQDMHAARVILNSGVPFVQIPCKNVSEHLTTTRAELEAHIAGRNALCDYLHEIFCAYSDTHFAWAKVIWDIAGIAWLLDAKWVPGVLTHSPLLTDLGTWSHDRTRHFIREAIHCDRNAIFHDLFRKLADADGPGRP